ncbi:MAG: ferrous iron transport protein B [Rhodospirillales bacterium RIFCSPLOWO2_12_FULL_58_28]|nr:MAG: ferrous iron transport protein B [Rhodospirillales bacterium RIFCSPLOWO2_02_FULL_58_16]OHC77580.1 MAG: ferrous iron transport protein B [Rhodospirillales bacterium RIFCSPLOWO2_12_FULL_58_28]
MAPDEAEVAAAGNTRTVTVALVGNPNCGKTTLFNRLTGLKKSTGNYPRVTVSTAAHEFVHRGVKIRLVDLPGIYSLNSRSPEERIGRDFIQDKNPDIVLNMLDAGNLDRSLFLTTQLIEMGCLRVYALNMIDEARRRGITLDTEGLASMLGGPVVETTASKGEGLERLLDAIVDMADAKAPPNSLTINYDKHLENAIGRMQALINELHPGMPEVKHSRWLAIKLLEGDDDVLRKEADHAHLVEMMRRLRYDLERTHGDQAEIMIADSRYGFIHGLLAEARTVAHDQNARLDPTRRIDQIMLHRIIGVPLFIGLLWVMFEATFVLGAYPMDMIDAGMTALSALVGGIIPPGIAHDVIVNGILAGVGGTIVFLPNVVILFFFMAVFSESGYLARTTFLLDRLMHPFGLHGKAFIPLVMGFGCNVPAIMATRTIESARSRLIAILITPFMACSARLPVFILFAGAFFSEWAGSVVFGMYMLSIFVAVTSSILISRFVVHGGHEPFVMELPPYRLPSIRAVFFHMWDNALEFLQKVGGVIVIGSMVIWFLQAFPRDVAWTMDYDAEITRLQAETQSAGRDKAITALEVGKDKEKLENSYLARASIAVTPLFAPIGFGWKDTTAIMTGFLAKEVVVASYSVLYAQTRDPNSPGLRSALAKAMSPTTALAFMVFALLYSPCLSTIAVIRRETGTIRWAVFSVLFSFSLAWFLAFGVAIVGGIFT